jgi:hypothetical protein
VWRQHTDEIPKIVAAHKPHLNEVACVGRMMYGFGGYARDLFPKWPSLRDPSAMTDVRSSHHLRVPQHRNASSLPPTPQCLSCIESIENAESCRELAKTKQSPPIVRISGCYGAILAGEWAPYASFESDFVQLTIRGPAIIRL